MSKIYSLVSAVLCLLSNNFSNAQVGPNLLGAKGTFSAPYITANTSASECLQSGANSYSPIGNIGNKLTGCDSQGSFLPCSDYNYSAEAGGLYPEFTYTMIKNIGDINGGSCIHGNVWKAQEHTGDGGYFMAVNGAAADTKSPLFYQIKSIPVCEGTTYEFSAWVINILPASYGAAPGSEPNISFKVNGAVIANSGPIAATNTPTWVKVGGTFTATTATVDLQVVNATFAANGNDLGLDDISFNVLKSNIAVSAPNAVCQGTSFTANYTVTDATQSNTWYKWQKSTNGGATFIDSTSGEQAVFTGNSYTLPLSFTNVSSNMNGYKYRLVASTSQAGLSSADCLYFNEYTALVNACGIVPVTMTSFNGKYSNGTAFLEWQTSQEFNSDRFEILKSTDGQDFRKIASVKSAGNSSTIKNYHYEDNNVNSGTYVYYRLKQVDVNGKYVFSPVVKIALGIQTGMNVFPNPFVENFTASFSASKTADAALVLRNATGQPVFKKTVKVNKGNNSVTVNNLPDLAPGMYYLSIVNDDINYNSKLQKK